MGSVNPQHKLESTHHWPHLPDEIEREIIFVATANSTGGFPTNDSDWHYLLIAKRFYRWFGPVLYRAVDIHRNRRAELFISSLRPRPDFARTAVKALRLRPPVSPAQGAAILKLCQGLQELTLQITVDLPDDRNALRKPLDTLKLTSLSMNLASGFYGPYISLPDLNVLHHVRCLHLTNGWVARRGLSLGLHKLQQLTHISFPIHPLIQEDVHTEILSYILECLTKLQVVVLWHMAYQESREIYDKLEKRGLNDPRIVIFNTERFAECENDFWQLAVLLVAQRRGDAKDLGDAPTTYASDNPSRSRLTLV